MSTGELNSRVAGVLRQQQEALRYRRHGANGMLPGLAHARVFQACQALVPGTQPGQVAELAECYNDHFLSSISRAKSVAGEVLSGTWKLLGGAVDLRNQIDWHRDPGSSHCWPRRFYAEIDLCPPGVDVKYVWELGRQQYLAELGRAWLLTGSEMFARRCRELITDWIDNNPLYEGVHWTSALEVAMRAISWIWTTAALAGWPGWRKSDLGKIASSLAQHATYLEHHLSYFSSPYNHLIGEATGLYLLGRALQSVDGADRWLRVGRKVLLEHGPRQFHADGMCVEQATGYHFYTLGFLTMAIAAARGAGEPLQPLEGVVHQAFRAGLALQQPDGRWPAIGDVDSARSIPVHHDDFWDFRSLLSVAAVLFDDPQLKAAAGQPGEELYWLLGCDGLRSWEELPCERPPTRVVLGDSGYVAARDGRQWLLFDAGPVAHGLHSDATPSSAHGHADTLQVLYFLDGRPVLNDPGMPSYVGKEDWVRHFRSPAAHNTIEIEGVEFVHDAGGLDWSQAASRPILRANLSRQAWLAGARCDWRPGVAVRRYLLGLPDSGLFIADYVQTDRPCTVRWYWQLPGGPVLLSCSEDRRSTQVTGDGYQLTSIVNSGSLECLWGLAHEASPVAWHAPGYGELRPGQRLCLETEVRGELLVGTQISPAASPWTVCTQGQQVKCLSLEGAPNCLTAPSPITSTSAEVVWQVWRQGLWQTFLAGLASEQNGSQFLRLNGEGDWPVALCHQQCS